MFQRHFISILIVAAILNPFCCCTANEPTDTLSSNKGFNGWKEISTEDNSVPPKAPCVDLESCPIQLVVNSKLVYQFLEYTAFEISPVSPAIVDISVAHWSFPSKEEKISLRQSFFSRLKVFQRLRRHQEICVYLN